MLYSVHNPFTGRFDYFEAKPEIAINNDLPTPRWDASIKTKIGVPAILAGRPLPPGAVQTGSGQMPKGLMSSGQPGEWTSTSRGNLPSGLGAIDSPRKLLPLVFLVAAGGSAVYGWSRQEQGWPFLGLSAGMLFAAFLSTRET